MSAVDLIGVMPKPLLDDAAEEGGPPGNSWSSRHSKNRVGTSAHAFIHRRFIQPRCGLRPSPLQRLGRERGRNILVEERDLVVVGLV